jgi:uncharacterized protein
MRFEWDEAKAVANLAKHGISFNEAATILGDTLGSTYPDSGRSQAERRWLTIGMSEAGRLLVVVHSEEGEQTIRIISARRATRKEREFYEDG